MSNWTGKGSDSRVSDYKSYWNCPLWDKKEVGSIEPTARVKRYLFLDDQRIPEKAYLYEFDKPLIKYSGISGWKWDIVKSYDEFVKYLETNGVPDVVSFDHDLFDVSDYRVSNEELSKQFQMIGWQEFKIKTGAHCAQYLKEFCEARKVNVPKFYIHTANSAARPIIREILENAIQF